MGEQFILDLFLTVKVPLEIFIVLVLLSGGVYLIVIIMSQSTPPPSPMPPPEPRSDFDAEAMGKLLVAMLEGRQEDFESILRAHLIPDDHGKVFVWMAAATLDVTLSDEHAQKGFDEKVSHLEGEDVPRGLAKILLILAMKAITDVAARQSSKESDGNVEQSA